MQTENKNTTAMIIASQNQDYVDEGLAEYQDQIHKLQSKSCIGYKYLKPVLYMCSSFWLLVDESRDFSHAGNCLQSWANSQTDNYSGLW